MKIKIDTKKIIDVVDKIASDRLYDEHHQCQKKPYHCKHDNEWADKQAEIECVFGHMSRTLRKTDKGKIDWKRVWGIFDHFADNSDIGEWDEQGPMISYLIGIFLMSKGTEKIEDSIVKFMFDFYNEPTTHREDAEHNARASAHLIVRCRKQFKGLNSNLSDKLEKRLKRINFFRGVQA